MRMWNNWKGKSKKRETGRGKRERGGEKEMRKKRRNGRKRKYKRGKGKANITCVPLEKYLDTGMRNTNSIFKGKIREPRLAPPI